MDVIEQAKQKGVIREVRKIEDNDLNRTKWIDIFRNAPQGYLLTMVLPLRSYIWIYARLANRKVKTRTVGRTDDGKYICEVAFLS